MKRNLTYKRISKNLSLAIEVRLYIAKSFCIIKDLLKNEKTFKKKINVPFLELIKGYYKIVKIKRGKNIW